MKTEQHKNFILGFIGQGWIGKNYADHYEDRGFIVIRYGLEDKYKINRDRIKKCDIVFIAVPTPTNNQGCDISILKEVLDLVGQGKTAVIKSTIIPGTIHKLQQLFPRCNVLHSPEFLTEESARYDVEHPHRNIIGFASEKGREAAYEVMTIFPTAPYHAVLPAQTAELIKYAGNCWFYTKIIFINMLYDLAQKLDIDYEKIREALGYDPRIGHSHLVPEHKDGRGAGGDCFIKDFAAFARLYKKEIPNDDSGHAILGWLQQKNIELLSKTGKDLDLLKQTYGKLPF